MNPDPGAPDERPEPIHLGYMSLPVEVQQSLEAEAADASVRHVLAALVEDVADALWRIEGNYQRETSGPGSRFEGQRLEIAQAAFVVRLVLQRVGQHYRADRVPR